MVLMMMTTDISECNGVVRNNSNSCSTNETTFTNSRKNFGGNSSYSCGYCNEKCMYSAVELAFIIGVLANVLVIGRVIKDRKLRDPTFIGIAALAAADLFFLTLNLTVSFETVIVTYTCTRPKIVSRPFYIMNSMSWFAANSHVALLAVIRYISLAHPVAASVLLRPLRVVLLSVGVWILGMILLGTLAGLITLRIIIPGSSREFVIIWWITVYLLPLIVTTLLHILKICMIKRSIRVSSAKSTNRKLVQRMSTIVFMVIFMAAVLPLPRLVYNCLRVVGDSAFPSKQFKIHLQGISHLLFLINHFINPFMYAFLSKKFRQSLKIAFCCSSTAVSGSSNTTESSSIQHATALETVTQKGTASDHEASGNIKTISHDVILETRT